MATDKPRRRIVPVQITVSPSHEARQEQTAAASASDDVRPQASDLKQQADTAEAVLGPGRRIWVELAGLERDKPMVDWKEVGSPRTHDVFWHGRPWGLRCMAVKMPGATRGQPARRAPSRRDRFAPPPAAPQGPETRRCLGGDGGAACRRRDGGGGGACQGKRTAGEGCVAPTPAAAGNGVPPVRPPSHTVVPCPPCTAEGVPVQTTHGSGSSHRSAGAAAGGAFKRGGGGTGASVVMDGRHVPRPARVSRPMRCSVPVALADGQGGLVRQRG